MNISDLLDPPDVTPLYLSIDNEDWSHPDLDKIAKENNFESMYPEIWTGNLVRIYLSRGDTTLYAVCLIDQNSYDKMMKKAMKNKHTSWGEYIVYMLKIVLFEDVWVVNDEQFCFTEYGKMVSDKIGFSCENYWISPDVGLHKDGSGFSS